MIKICTETSRSFASFRCGFLRFRFSSDKVNLIMIQNSIKPRLVNQTITVEEFIALITERTFFPQ